jgi:hypothetical protein
MTRTFAAWVEPIAAQQEDHKSQVLAFARSQPADAWGRPCGGDGWTCKDVLAHIGKANDQLFQNVLREVIAGRHIDRAVLDIDTDGDNERLVAERREWPIEQVIAEVEEAEEEILDLLSQLTEDHQGYRQDDPPFVLSGFVRLVEGESHALEHLAQLRTAMEAAA